MNTAPVGAGVRALVGLTLTRWQRIDALKASGQMRLVHRQWAITLNGEPSPTIDMPQEHP